MARREFEIPEFALPRTGFTTGILRAQDDRQLPRLPDEGQVDRDVRLAQRYHEEKPQRRQGVVDGWHAGTARDQMQLIAAHVLEVRRARRSPEKRAGALDGADVAFLGPRGRCRSTATSQAAAARGRAEAWRTFFQNHSGKRRGTGLLVAGRKARVRLVTNPLGEPGSSALTLLGPRA